MVAVTVAICVAVALGVAAERRWGRGAHRATARVLDLMLVVVLPPVLFLLMARLELTAGIGAGIGLAYITMGIVGTAAWATGRWLLRLPRASTGALIVCCIVVNTGFLGVPLVAVVLGLLAPDALAPQALADGARHVAFVLLPVGFFVLGVNLAAEAQGGSLALPPAFSRAVAAVIALRMALGPAVLAGLAALTISVPDPYLLQAAMPSGITCLLIAHVYGLDVRLASSAVAWTTAVAVVAGLGSGVL